MVYPHLSLALVSLVVGLALIAAHLFALWQPEPTKALLGRLPRSKMLGQVLFTVAALWFFALAATMDLGEFSSFRRGILLVTAVAYVLVLKYGEDYLAVRALGILALLAAEPVLEAAFLQPQASRLFLVVLAYLWVIAGLFWVGMPHLLRDQIGWVLKRNGADKLLCGAGVLYGVVLVISGLTQYR